LPAGDVWPSRAAKKSAEAIANFPDAIKQGKDLAHIKGVGKGTVKKARRRRLGACAECLCVWNAGARRRAPRELSVAGA